MKRSDIEEGFVSVNGLQLYYKIIGQGEPVVISHGGPGFDHNYILPMSGLADGYRVIFYDQRSTGNSTGTVDADSMTLDNFAQDLEGLRRKLNLGKVNLIGHSWGGGLAVYYAIKYPMNLRSLTVLGAGGPDAKYFEQYYQNIQKRTSPEDAVAMKEIKQSKAFKNRQVEAVEKYYRIATKPFFYDPSLAGRLDFFANERTASNQSKAAAFIMKDISSFDVYDKLSAIKCPMLIMCGDADPGPRWGPYKLHKLVPQSKLVFLKNTGHFVFIESPEETLSVIRDFLRDNKTVATSIPVDSTSSPQAEIG
jgi:proline iminopeptidase